MSELRPSGTISPGGDRRTVTVTFGYPDRLRTLVAHNLRLALVMAEARWGRWQTIESISTPDTIYSDVTGRTKALAQPGIKDSGSHQSTAAKLRRIGYHPAPGEIGTLRYFRTELVDFTARKAKRGRRRFNIPPRDQIGRGDHD